LPVAWSSELLADKPADLFVPDSPAPPRGVVLFLHGYDGVTLRDNAAYTSELARHGLACLCPIGPECCWTDRVHLPFDAQVSPLEFLARHVPEFCRVHWQIEPPHIALCGVEMGGQGALQLAYRHARQFPIVAAISPKVDFETWYGHGTSLDNIFPNREAARQATVILHLHPLNWPKHQLLLCDAQDNYCRDGVLTLMSKLSSTGIPFDADTETTHGGFGWAYANHMAPRAVSFLAERLVLES
jgi:pimeloyl-ACP methyl ester carboxylesterase